MLHPMDVFPAKAKFLKFLRAVLVSSWGTGTGVWVPVPDNWPSTALPRSFLLLVPPLYTVTEQATHFLRPRLGCWAALDAHSEGFPFPNPLSQTA